MGKKYPHWVEGDAVDIEWRKHPGFKFACCDCGLTHLLTFAVAGKKIRMRVYRDDRATGQIRHHMKKNGEGLWEKKPGNK